jgi:hypothetical protein
MQSIIGGPAVEQPDWDTIEEQPLTFQIALVGRDGLVIGSDQLGRYVPISAVGKPQFSQIAFQPKYCVSANQSLVCFAAGSAVTAISLARQICVDCDPALKLKDAGESEWEHAVLQVATVTPSLMSHYQFATQILVARTDIPDAFWLVLIRPDAAPTVSKMKDQFFCTGTSTVAQFLPRHLWTVDRSVSELKKLTLLTLSYAAKEEPSSVGPPFDIMTLDRTGHISWSVHKQPDTNFQDGLA